MKYKIPAPLSIAPGLLLFLAGCASTLQIVPVATGPTATNSAHIVVSRSTGSYGWAEAFAISDNGTHIGDIGPKGQLVWDRSPGLMVMTATATLNSWLPEESRRGTPLRLGVGAGMKYEIEVYFPFCGTVSPPPTLKLMSGTPVPFEDNGTNTPGGYIQQTPGQNETNTFTGTITRKGFPNPMKFRQSGKDISAIVTVVGDAGEKAEFFVFYTSTIIDGDGKKSTATPGRVKTNKRVEIEYSIVSDGHRNLVGKNRVISIRYLD